MNIDNPHFHSPIKQCSAIKTAHPSMSPTSYVSEQDVNVRNLRHVAPPNYSPAFSGLVVFEASSLGRKHSPLINSELATQKTHDSVTEKKSEGNLNRLDPTTRVVSGVRERKYINYHSDLVLLFCIIVLYCSIANRVCVCLHRVLV